MIPTYACGSSEHLIARRSLLSGLVAGGFGLAGGVGGWLQPAAASGLASTNKRVLFFYLEGGLSQLESWDPKPGTETGGPFRTIPTSVPGLHVCELLPHTAQQMHHLAIIRSMNTRENTHAKGHYLMQTGRRHTPAANHPRLGAIIAHQLQREAGPLPGNIRVGHRGGGGRSRDAGFLGAEFGSTVISANTMPRWSQRPDDLPLALDELRRGLRQRLDARFSRRRGSAATTAYAHSFDKATQLMEQRDVFNIEKEPSRDHDRYGPTDFGKQCLLARRLLEHDVPFVWVNQENYDTHNENFNFHLARLAEFDRPFATIIQDLAERGLLEHTLVLVASEFGRTPRINYRLGRDHWSRSWSVVIGGTGIQPGAVVGKTNKKGTEVVDREVDQRHLYHTILDALGLDPHGTFEVGGQSIPIAEPSGSTIQELLA